MARTPTAHASATHDRPSTGSKNGSPSAGNGAGADDALARTQTDGVATAADAEMAASLPESARPVESDISIAIVNLLRDPALAASLHAHAAEIEAEGRGTVDDILARVPGFIFRYDANQRLLTSQARVHDSLVRDNADFVDFVTAAAAVYKKAGPLSAIKKDAALRKLTENRDVQRGQAKAVKTRNKKRAAKKA